MQLPLQPISLPEEPDQTDGVNTLTGLERQCWNQLKSVLRRRSTTEGFHTMTVATSTSRGADARLVVLRAVDAIHKYVWFYTDARSEKVLQLEASPMATLLLWDSKRQVQLRLVVETRLHTDDYIADGHWKKLGLSSRKAYLSEKTPGSEQPQPYPGYPEEWVDKLPTPEASEAGRVNFAVIECRVLAMEYLHLSRSGQQRACFQYEPESKMVWLAP
ncbi:pyridoxamine 5'-phosphate oxidase family protein [Spirosoma koreense]